jgi:DNA-binding NarL/FixJ family response regulator
MDAHIVSSIKATVLSLDSSMNPHLIENKKQEIISLLDAFAANFLLPIGKDKPLHEKLSAREREVFDMILSGKRLKEIGAMLDISVKTVTTHRSRLMKKIGVDDNLGLYRYGIRQGLIGL